MTKQEKIKKVQEIINREKLNGEKIYAICMYPRGMANSFNLTDLSQEEHDLVKYCFTHYSNCFTPYSD